MNYREVFPLPHDYPILAVAEQCWEVDDTKNDHWKAETSLPCEPVIELRTDRVCKITERHLNSEWLSL